MSNIFSFEFDLVISDLISSGCVLLLEHNSRPRLRAHMSGRASQHAPAAALYYPLAALTQPMDQSMHMLPCASACSACSAVRTAERAPLLAS